jgi:two-component system cell cycle response regulator CtrA
MALMDTGGSRGQLNGLEGLRMNGRTERTQDADARGSEMGSEMGTVAAPARTRFAAPQRTTRLLLVEDDRLLSDALSRMLELAGFTVYVTGFGEDALDLARAYRFDVVVLDLTLPDMTGGQVLQQLHQMRPDTPVIILSGEGRLETKIENFLEGADDYITKPFHRDELLARVHAVLRRSRAAAPQDLQLGVLSLDLVAHRASVGGVQVPLTGKEYACLEYLATRRGMTVTKEMFLAHLYGGRDEPEMKIIDVFICKLRRKLSEAGAPPVIETVWGRGYTIPTEG